MSGSDEDFGDIPESIPRKPTRMTKCLSASFLSMFDEILPTSSTIWDHCANELDVNGDARFPATSIDDLLSSFQDLLAPEIILQVRNNLEDLKYSNLGIETALVSSKASILGNILQDLKRVAYDSDDDDSSAARERREARQEKRFKEVAHFYVDLSQEGKRSKELERVYVNMSLYKTPPNPGDKTQQKTSIKERARIFSQDRQVLTCHTQLHRGRFVSLYHGTRLSSLQSFSRVGVLPYTNDTQYSPTPAFYVTNDVCSSFEFPLLGYLRELQMIKWRFSLLRWMLKFCMADLLPQLVTFSQSTGLEEF